MRSLVLKEIQSFFSSLIGYTVVAVFLLFTSLFLWLFPGGWNVLDSGMASLSPFFAMAPWVLMPRTLLSSAMLVEGCKVESVWMSE